MEVEISKFDEQSNASLWQTTPNFGHNTGMTYRVNTMSFLEILFAVTRRNHF
jgi:hypothetical protein